MMEFGRRDVIRILGAAMAMAPAPALARLGVADDLAVFRDIIRAVGGTNYMPQALATACETEFARAFGVEAMFSLVALARRRPVLDDMAADASTRAADQLRWIATFLYTGEVDGEVRYYDYCLGWQSLTFATAPGLCGGPFGHWVEPQR
ncbi:hypothetical protein [Phaeobacter sp. J2-8]|uniref:hypothetical protein n=1 Tax=Phaeobacter sp. J2-8 TaxID=2931394 RepID=UPI001FD29604|nr:hypothetical protein [Phaeobacter sp. J2-8]MCJ7872698.1 hypothetical protein [Phaeobacter sp. J2-8]